MRNVKLVRKADMIDSKLAKLESLMDGVLTRLNDERRALRAIKIWLEEVDRDTEVIPDTCSKRLEKLLRSLKGSELNTAEKKVAKKLIKES